MQPAIIDKHLPIEKIAPGYRVRVNGFMATDPDYVKITELGKGIRLDYSGIIVPPHGVCQELLVVLEGDILFEKALQFSKFLKQGKFSEGASQIRRFLPSIVNSLRLEGADNVADQLECLLN